tara:strand:+ start:188 stop:1435 length:1248 start_codon:yes stop_codon:yes gene_type:complete
MFSIALKKFEYLRKTSFKSKEYDQSASDLFELILSKKIKKNQKFFFEFPTNLILLILSLLSVLKVKIMGVKNVNYFIVFNEKLYDPRTNTYVSKINQKNYLNIIRSSNFIFALKAFFKYKNVFFHQSVVYFSRLFFFEKEFSLKKKFLFIHKCNLRKQMIYFKLFKFLKIKKLLMIDDYREMQHFISICKKLKIYSVGFMHSRFSKFRVSLKYECFDKYIVWTDYFKSKLLKINPKYKKKILINNFRNFKRIKKYKLSNKLIILFFSDSMMDYKSVIKYLDKLKNKDIEIIVKLKNNQSENINFLRYINNNQLLNVSNLSIDSIIKIYKPNFFVATNSNVLLEATLYDCYPILLKTKNDYSFDLIEDNVVIEYSDKNDPNYFLQNIKKNKFIKNRIFNKVWKTNKKFTNLGKILL